MRREKNYTPKTFPLLRRILRISLAWLVVLSLSLSLSLHLSLSGFYCFVLLLFSCACVRGSPLLISKWRFFLLFCFFAAPVTFEASLCRFRNDSPSSQILTCYYSLPGHLRIGAKKRNIPICYFSNFVELKMKKKTPPLKSHCALSVSLFL